MSKFSNYTENQIIESTLRGNAFVLPTTVYIALFTADPTDADITANEVQTAAFTSYARQDASGGVGGPSSGWAAASNGVSSNAKIITFPDNDGAAPVIVTHIGIYDAATGGNLLYHSDLVTSKTLQIGDVLSFAVGAITITVA